MKFTVLIETPEQNKQPEVSDSPEIRNARRTHEDAAYLICDGRCPRCNDFNAGLNGFDLQGDTNSKIMLNDHDFVCVGFCVACRKPVGTLKVVYETLFGLEEDARVLHGRPRVY